MNPSNPAAPFEQLTRWASNLKARHTDEFILGLEHELMTDFSVGVNATYRKLSDFIETIGEHHKGEGDYYSQADYVLSSTPATATLPNGTKVSMPYYVLAPGVPRATYFVVINRPDYYQSYESLDLFGRRPGGSKADSEVEPCAEAEHPADRCSRPLRRASPQTKH